MAETSSSRAAADAGTTIPPVMRTVAVGRPVEEAFRIFTEEFGSWWPLDAYSRAYSERKGQGVKAETVVMEGRTGGRIYEVMSDGTESSWGEVLAWEPPHRLVLAWKPNQRPTPPTEVEVRFAPEAEGTRVDLEHRGWERLGDEALEARKDYEGGWPGVLARYQEVAEAAR